MKYTSPIYRNEILETEDAITASIVSIKYVPTKVVNSNGELEDVTATQVGVDIGSLF